MGEHLIGTVVDPQSRPVDRLRVDLRIGQGQHRGSDSELDVAAHHLDTLPLPREVFLAG